MSGGKVGRPYIALTAEQVELIEKLASYGLTQEQIADFLPFSEETFKNRLRDPDETEIQDAYRRGRAMDARTLAQRHRDIALGTLVDDAGECIVPVADQRKALEWRLERHHKLPALHEVTGEIPVIVIERAPDDDD